MAALTDAHCVWWGPLPAAHPRAVWGMPHIGGHGLVNVPISLFQHLRLGAACGPVLFFAHRHAAPQIRRGRRRRSASQGDDGFHRQVIGAEIRAGATRRNRRASACKDVIDGDHRGLRRARRKQVHLAERNAGIL